MKISLSCDCDYYENGCTHVDASLVPGCPFDYPRCERCNNPFDPYESDDMCDDCCLETCPSCGKDLDLGHGDEPGGQCKECE